MFRTRPFRLAVALIAGTFCVGSALAADLYVSPTGMDTAAGTREQPLSLKAAFSAQSPAKPGDTIYLMGGTYEGPLSGQKREYFHLDVAGAAGKPIKIKPVPGSSVHLNGAVELKGSYLEVYDLEIGDLRWDPTKPNNTPTAFWGSGGSNCTIINCNIFGGSMGTGLWSPCKEITLYGCLVHDFGGLEAGGQGRGHGHAFYTQNETGTKTLEQNIAWRGCGWNLHVYTQSGQIVGYRILDNIMYIAGAVKPGQTMDNYLVSGYPPADRISIIGNVGYQPSMAQAYRPNARMGNYKPALNGSGEFKNNYMMGAVYGLSLGNWKSLEMSGNTIWSTGILVEISSAPTGSGIHKQDKKPDLAGYKLSKNTYIDNGQAKPFMYADVPEERVKEPENPYRMDFAAWQKLGLDQDSQVIKGKDGKPAGTKVIVYANKYTKGRGHVAIFNWDGKDQIEADLSTVLSSGQKFAIYNCLDIKQTIALAKPVLEGAYDGKPVALPMRKDKISPDFDAFLVLPVAK